MWITGQETAAEGGSAPSRTHSSRIAAIVASRESPSRAALRSTSLAAFSLNWSPENLIVSGARRAIGLDAPVAFGGRLCNLLVRCITYLQEAKRGARAWLQLRGVELGPTSARDY